MAKANSTPSKHNDIYHAKATIPDDVLKNLSSLDPLAVRLLAGFGPGYFNPLIGFNPAETCEKIADVMCFLHNIMDSHEDFTEGQRGIALMVQTVWSAAQYEGNRCAGNTPSRNATEQS